ENTFYSPYGELLGGGTSDVKLYTGQFSDSSTNQYYYGARYYKPSTGQFISPDTIISQMYNPQSLNRYSYVLGNPYKYFDPNGKEPIKSQLGSVDAITNYIVTLEKSNPNAKPTEILNMIVANTGTFESRPDWFGSGYPNDARYLYTKDKGFVDTYHFFANAELVRTIEGSTLPILDYWQEFGQYRSSSDKISGFSYEDIPSNRLGRLFGNSVTNDKTLSQQFSQFMQNIGASSNPLSDAESQHPGLLSTLPENEPTDRSNLLPESKRCFFCVGPALPSEFKPSFIDRIGTGIGNFFGGIFK
ncbi:MAG: hypothetical protein HYW23_01220, partial [Candidatus Aenigmarchaeota archaeon]|nr:hypothetical protein [Candidatus Aenigmarchaeota archaeon]